MWFYFLIISWLKLPYIFRHFFIALDNSSCYNNNVLERQVVLPLFDLDKLLKNIIN